MANPNQLYPLDPSDPVADPQAAPVASPEVPVAATDPVAAPAPVPSSPLQNPVFAAFLAKKAEDKAALASAQGKAEVARKWADVGNGFRRAADVFAGRHTDEGALQANLDAADRPVRDLLLRQQGDRQSLADFGAEQDFQQKLLSQQVAQQQLAQRANKDSAVSKSMRLLFKQFNPDFPEAQLASLSAMQLESLDPSMKAFAEVYEKRQSGIEKGSLATKATADAAKAAAETKEVAKDSASKRALEAAQAAEATAKALMAQQKPIPEAYMTKLNNQIEALKALDQLEGLHKEIGVLGLSPIGNSAKNRYDDAIKALGPAIASGSLPLGKETPAAVDEFIRMMPGAVTGHDRAKAFFDRSREAIRGNIEGQRSMLGAVNTSPAQLSDIDKRVKATGGSTPKKSDEGTVDVVSPEGVPGQIPAKNLDAALKRGFKRG